MWNTTILVKQLVFRANFNFGFFVLEVSVDATFDPTRFIWAAVDLSLQVTVLDDGQPLQEDKNITLTLAKIAGGKSSDIIVTEAIIAVRAQKIPGL